ncbi:cell division protein FtsZ [Metasolibacillus meyeri]|uniref:Cell division protein FtsZ n=1 Tax=Metasolibacillus meyeri TaxID=1071052 RepID=A0AAW9NNK7_9BACL|nr:cell division protein FtsZ [Metasolibacillus meyeri]MEC1177314.1 cell division protein FtsZ [Metasolibacillus meyeri]
MTKNLTFNQPAMDMTMVGFGQAGSRIVDELAKFHTAEGQQTYHCFALNSNDGDLKGLKFIDPNNRVSLELGGLGKNPEKAMKILAANPGTKERMAHFITKKLNTDNQPVIFFAGLGGGTGTATIIQAIQDFHNHYNKPKIEQVLKAMIEQFGEDTYKAKKNEFHQRAFQIAAENFRKIGVVACIPLRKDGPDVLRQVNKFAQEIWALANDVTKSVAWVTFPDNQFFYEQFSKLPQNKKEDVDNFRDYSNREIANTIHRINVAANIGGTSLVLDSQDLKRAWWEHQGCLIMSRQEVPVGILNTNADVTKLFTTALSKSHLHGHVNLVNKEGEVSQVHHVGLLAILDRSKDFGNGSFIENAVENLHEILPVSGTVFSGYIEESNNENVTVYTFYKAKVLPERLEKGLVEEYEQYMKENKELHFTAATIRTIQEDAAQIDADAFADIGIDLLAEEPQEVKKETSIEEQLEGFDFSF